MPETEYSQINLAAIRTRLDNLERMTRLTMAANPNGKSYIENVFRRQGSAAVYLALEAGPKTQEDLTQKLGKSQPTISRAVNYLYESGLIDRISAGGKTLWGWHDLERTWGISRVARRFQNKQKAADGASEPHAPEVPSDG